MERFHKDFHLSLLRSFSRRRMYSIALQSTLVRPGRQGSSTKVSPTPSLAATPSTSLSVPTATTHSRATSVSESSEDSSSYTKLDDKVQGMSFTRMRSDVLDTAKSAFRQVQTLLRYPGSGPDLMIALKTLLVDTEATIHASLPLAERNTKSAEACVMLADRFSALMGKVQEAVDGTLVLASVQQELETLAGALRDICDALKF
eukprot:m.454422 g.454422  ORF g.454422 m.454422 type:complete len:203 (+) comp56952_c1_seq4:1603-2211(+)